METALRSYNATAMVSSISRYKQAISSDKNQKRSNLKARSYAEH